MQNTMIPLTIANTLNQSVKQRIEVAPAQTLKAAVQQHNLAPKGDFDIFDREGKVITNQPAQDFRDATVYIGVPKIAGGAIHGGFNRGFDLDDDDDDGWDLDLDEPQVKPREVNFILQSGERHVVQPDGNELLIDTYNRVIGAPRDGSPLEIWDLDGNIVSSRVAKDMIGRTFRVAMRAIPGGGGGISMDEFKQLRAIDFPSMRHINKHSSKKTVGAFSVMLNGVFSFDNPHEVMYHVVVDLRQFPECPRAYILSPQCVDISHSNIFKAKRFEIAPNRELCELCVGAEYKSMWPHIKGRPLEKLGSFLDQIISVLKNPNPDDPAREVAV
jgi:hypothetical protein